MSRFFLFAAIMLAIALGCAVRSFLAGPAPAMPAAPCRIASLSPGITDSLVALGLEDRIAGVTRHCRLPGGARKAVVGGFMEVNLEALARLRPDLAILPADMAHYRGPIESIGVPVATFDGTSLSGFLRDLEKISRLTGTEEAGKRITDAFRASFSAPDPPDPPDPPAAPDPQYSPDSPGRARVETGRPRVLFALMNPEDCLKPVQELNALGRDGFYDELVRAAGGENACRSEAPWPRLSRESMLALNPDVLIVAAPGCADAGAPERAWGAMAGINDVKNGHVLVLTDPADTVPGPGSLETLKKMARVIGEAAR